MKLFALALATLTLSLSLPAFADENSVTVTFSKQMMGDQPVLVLNGTDAAALHSLLPPASPLGGAGELAKTKGELHCSGSPLFGNGINYECFMLLKK